MQPAGNACVVLGTMGSKVRLISNQWRVILGGILLAIPLAVFAQQIPSEGRLLERISEKLDRTLRRSFVPGMSVVIVKDDKVIYARGFGWRDVAKKLPVTADTVFCIGSASKAFTCLLATQAAAEDKLKLSDNPTKYIPEFIPSSKEQRDKLTIADIMSHRSGFPRTDFAWWAGDFSSEELVRILDGAKPTNRIGEKFLYQNMMLMLTGMIDAKVYGEPYADLVHDRIFEPLGMARSSARTHFLAEQADHATGYDNAGPLSPERPLDLHDVDAIGPAGSIVSTANDLGNWLRLQLKTGNFDGRQLFSTEAVLEQRKPRIDVVEGLGYGFGWMLGKWGSTPQVDHGGNIDGFSAEVSMLPEKHIGVAVLTNGSASPVPNLAKSIVYEEFVGPETPIKTGNKMTGKSAAKAEFKDADESLAGVYESKTPPISLKLAKKGSQWTLSQGAVTLSLKKIADQAYAFENPAAPKVRLAFVPSEMNPKVTELLLEQGSIKVHFAKAPPYKAPMSASELIAKVIEATGGASAFEKLGHVTTHFESVMPADGVRLYGIRYTRNGVETAEFAQAYALQRKFASILSIATPAVAGQLLGHVRAYPVRTTPDGKPDAELDVLAFLHPNARFQKLTITGEEPVSGENAYLLEGTDKSNLSVQKYWISTKTFRLLKKSASTSGGAYSTYGNYREVDGVWVPFSWTIYSPDGSPTITEFKSYDFTGRIPDWPFKFPSSGRID